MLADAMGMADNIDEFERKFTRRVGNKISLVEYSDGDCIFLDPKSRTCSVYEARPVQCRTWPFWNSNLELPRDWASAARSCPGCNKGRLYSIEEIRERLTKEL
jgi:Fe-S-cluster containining protein